MYVITSGNRYWTASGIFSSRLSRAVAIDKFTDASIAVARNFDRSHLALLRIVCLTPEEMHAVKLRGNECLT